MWYEILVENEFADYFINNDIDPEDATEKQKAEEMLQGCKDVIYGATMAWTFYDSSRKNSVCGSLARLNAHAAKSFEFCCSRIPLSKAKHLGEIFRSIPSDVSLEMLSAEQCAVSLMYPFWSRMGGSFEKEFQESGSLKKHLLVLKSKCKKD
ncbi:MAG: hypothetical protein J6B09_02230 [Clostridia bacterium]|nr:hypothetical protein [Clostridia bacterium]